ncbi:ATP-binding protein [Longimicrobium sp.]|uniref:ATP-binding protein n=1 Tax=Longimicrobium sp. TaxID=2029185 RepID=UPI002BB8DC92|nr:ATP-binding protein [Longimicrobium sp.]HSU13238.1 ATP-binding protein [Longimicrobium sp.]
MATLERTGGVHGDVHRHILVLNVDDYEAGRYATSRVLRQAGFDVIEAATGIDGLRLATEEAGRLDLVLLDVNLPDVDGFEVCRRIRANPRLASLPVLYLSAAYRTSEHRVQGLELGADGYLTQPVEPRELVATVNALLRAREVDEAIRRSEERFRALVAGTSDILWTAGASGVHETSEGWTAFTGSDAAGDGWLAAVHPAERDRAAAAWTQAVAAGTHYRDEYRLRRADGEYRDTLAIAVPVPLADGGVREWIASSVDVTGRRREEEWQRLFGEAGAELGSTVEPESTLPRIAALALGRLAAWCAVELCSEDGEPRPSASASASAFPPEVADALRRLGRSGTVDVRAPGPRALRPVRTAPEEGSEAAAAGVRSVLSAPMVARGHLLGVVTLAATEGMTPYGERDQAQLEELAGRMALALDNGRLYQSALQANAAKGQFLAVMSHELRTPLNAIIGYADLLDAGVAGDLSTVQREHLGRIRAGSKHLLRLIEDVLLFSRIEAGRETVMTDDVELGLVVREAASMVEPLAVQKGLRFTVVTPDEPVHAATDEGKLHQIVLNLLSNSVKFTDAGEIRVELSRAPGGEARISVSDTGIGIAPENLERIFDAFSQVEQAPTRRVGGTGLGLSVTRNLARLLGGDVEVESRFPGGSIFTVRIPPPFQHR